MDGGRIIYMLDIGKLKALKCPTFWFENTPQGKFVLNMAFGQSKYYWMRSRRMCGAECGRRFAGASIRTNLPWAI